MALSNFLIRPPSDAQKAQAGAPRRTASAQAGNPASFANIMSGQTTNAENASTAEMQRAGTALTGNMGQQGIVLAGRSPSDLARTHVLEHKRTTQQHRRSDCRDQKLLAVRLPPIIKGQQFFRQVLGNRSQPWLRFVRRDALFFAHVIAFC